MIAALADAVCRFAAADPLSALFISGVLIAALLGIAWGWVERLERPS
jgi:F0F1-type ATP synthase assembly protein I